MVLIDSDFIINLKEIDFHPFLFISFVHKFDNCVFFNLIIQLFCIFIGLWLCIPFSLNHPAVKSFSPEIHDWFGDLPARQFGRYLDYALLLILGSVPWQVYFQRVLSSRSAFKAKMLSYVAAFGCIVMAIPSMIIGAVARVTVWGKFWVDPNLQNKQCFMVQRVIHLRVDEARAKKVLSWTLIIVCIAVWEETDFKRPLDDSHTSLVLPMVLQYLTPPLVQFVGLGAVSAAVMSSSDLSLLSASLMFARNVYKLMIRSNLIVWVMRVSIIVVGAIATTMAFYVKSIYGLWYLSSDIVYVVLFPRLVCVVYFKRHCYTYGSLAAYVLGFLFLLARFNYPSFQTLNNIFKASNQPKTIAMLRKLRANHKRNKIFHRRIKISTKTNAMDYQLNLMVVT
uniref:Uncharacterized protein n=1 Tax=Tetranychus urticae TaxID=32264 RepID=T1L1W5_TETUR